MLGKGKFIRSTSVFCVMTAIWMFGVVTLWLMSDPRNETRALHYSAQVYDAKPGALIHFQDPTARFAIFERNGSRRSLARPPAAG